MATTADDVWRILAELATAQKETEKLLKEQSQETERRFQETERRFQETERRFQETERRFQETERRFQETERRFQETERRFQETERRFQETERLLKEQSQETERRFQETERLLKEQSQATDRQLQRTDLQLQETDLQLQKLTQQVDRVSQQIGDLGGKWGRFVENMVAPACETLFSKRGIPVHQVSQRVRKRLNGNTLEFDMLVTNQDHVLVVEVKSTLRVDDIQYLMEDLQEFRQFFPEYEQKQLYGAVAAMEIEESVYKYAYRQGLFVLALSGETMVILNSDDFQPKVW